FFSRITKFKDPYEGAMPKTLRTVLDVLGRDHPKIRLADKLAEEAKLFCVSCWHVNDGESAAMWKLYSQEDSGIAVQSSVDRLNKGFRGQNYDIATVTYT